MKKVNSQMNRRTSWRNWSRAFWPALVLILIVTLRGPVLLGRIWGNIGRIVLASGLTDTQEKTMHQAAMQAETLLRQAMVYAPDDHSFWRGVGFALAAQGRESEAIAAWQAAGKTPEEFIRWGDRARLTERYEEALIWYGRASQWDPKRAEPWYGMGQTYEEMNEWKKALLAYQESWKYDPASSAEALAIAFQRLDDFQSMETIVRQALADFPEAHDRVSWWYLLSESLGSQEKWDESALVCQAALREFPDNPLLHIGLGWSYYERGDGTQPAIDEFQQAIALDEEQGAGYFAVGQLLVREERYADADRWFRLALKRNSDDRRWYLARANAAREARNLSLALQIYRELLARFPNYAQAYYDAAWAYYLDNQPDRAVESIEQALVLMNDPPQRYHVRAGQIYEWAGDSEKAIASYHRALDINPNNSIALQGIERLEGGQKE